MHANYNTETVTFMRGLNNGEIRFTSMDVVFKRPSLNPQSPLKQNSRDTVPLTLFKVHLVTKVPSV